MRWGTICFNLLQSDTPRVLVIQSIVYCALSVVPSLLCIVLNSSDQHWKTPSHSISSPITLSHVFVDSLTHPHSHLHTQTMIRPTSRPSSKHNQTDKGTSTGTEIASPMQRQTSSDLLPSTNRCTLVYANTNVNNANLNPDRLSYLVALKNIEHPKRKQKKKKKAKSSRVRLVFRVPGLV